MRCNLICTSCSCTFGIGAFCIGCEEGSDCLGIGAVKRILPGLGKLCNLLIDTRLASAYSVGLAAFTRGSSGGKHMNWISADA